MVMLRRAPRRLDVAACTLYLCSVVAVPSDPRNIASPCEKADVTMLVRNRCRLPAALVLALCCSTFIAAFAAAQEYVSGLPEPARVFAAYEGPDSLDRTARQHAALRVIRQLITDLSYDRIARDRARGRPFVLQTPDEQRLMGAYAAAEGQVRDPAFDKAETQRLGAAAPLRRWVQLVDHYAMLDTQFKDDVLHRFFSPDWVAGYLAAKGRLGARMAASTREHDSIRAADSVAEELAVRPFHAEPVPPGERRFAMDVNRWCHGTPADTGNPIVVEQAQREFSLRLAAIVRAVGPITDWSGILLSIKPGSQFSDPSVTISVDTVSSYRSGEVAEYVAVAGVTGTFSSRSPAYAVASRLQVGQRVFFSGRALEAGSEQLSRGEAEQEQSCHNSFGMALTALRPAP